MGQKTSRSPVTNVNICGGVPTSYGYIRNRNIQQHQETGVGSSNVIIVLKSTLACQRGEDT